MTTECCRSSDKNCPVYLDIERVEHKYLLGLEVVRDMYALSYCNGLIAGLSQVSICSRIVKKSRKEEYEYLKIIDHGLNNNPLITVANDKEIGH